MKVVFNHYNADDTIPVKDYIKNRKMVKYYNREAQAALVAIGMLFGDKQPDIYTPVFYAICIIEHSEFDVYKIAVNSIDDKGTFNNKAFIKSGMRQISPLTQFKVLYSMTLCFISIEYGLKGDNAAIYASAAGLINNALYSEGGSEIIIGTGKIYADGSVDTGFALTTKQELEAIPPFDSHVEAIELFKYLKKGI
jgi:hypothetical protein